MADYFSSTDEDEEEFYGFTEAEINYGRLRGRFDEEMRDGSDVEVEEFSEDESEGEGDDEGEGLGLNANREVGGDVELAWTKQLTSNRDFLPFTEDVGPTVLLDKEAKELDFFYQIFPEELYTLIALETNKYAIFKRHPPILPDKHWVPTNADEVKLYIGIRIYMSIVNLPSVNMYWSNDKIFGNFPISEYMSRNRFQKLTEYLHVADKAQMLAKGCDNYDKLYLIRPVIDIINQRCLDAYKPHQNFAIDEAMIKFRGRLGLKQYMPAKPTKYGIKVWMRADSANGFCNEFAVYTGKQEGGQAEKRLGAKVVKKLTENIEGKGHHGFTDKYFTSVAGVEERFQKDVYICGTIKANAAGLPKEIKNKNVCKEEGSSEIFQKGNTALTAVAWREKKSRKPVCILSANLDPASPMSHVSRRQKDGGRKDIPCPLPVESYNGSMNAVDHNDQIRTQYMTYRKSRRWWTYIFWFLFDVAIANSLTLFRESPNHRRVSSAGNEMAKTQADFRKELAKQLISTENASARKRRRTVTVQQQRGNIDGHWPKFLKDHKGRCRNCSSHGKRREPKYICMKCTEESSTNERIHLCPDCFQEYHEKRQ